MTLFLRYWGITLVFLLAQLASAHDLNLTLVQMVQDGPNVKVSVLTPLSRFIANSGLSASAGATEVDHAVRGRLHLASHGRQIYPGTETDLVVDSRRDMLRWSATVVGQVQSVFVVDGFDQTSPSARTIVSRLSNGQVLSDYVLAAETTSVSGFAMISAGIQHIISGWDHVFFVLGLVLVGGSWRSLLKVLTAFTVAHCITLALSVSRVMVGNPRIVEPLIALSIVALAIEGLISAQKSGVSPTGESSAIFRTLLAFGFGLVHGLGFAGGLSNLGLQGWQLAQNLVTFNIGIELGQIVTVVPALALAWLIARRGEGAWRRTKFIVSITIGMIGSFWFVERLLSQ